MLHFTKESGSNIGQYCSQCKTWNRWLNKEERNLLSKQKSRPEVVAQIEGKVLRDSDYNWSFETKNRGFSHGICIAIDEMLEDAGKAVSSRGQEYRLTLEKL